MDNMVLKVEYREVYGKELVYPICAKAHAIARLAGDKTLTPRTIKIAKELGYRVEVGLEEILEEIRREDQKSLEIHNYVPASAFYE
tara:strand:+ start:1699 stop:1956 length:258 start_codon:yes stop_codon:yes gene_type:complete